MKKGDQLQTKRILSLPEQKIYAGSESKKSAAQ